MENEVISKYSGYISAAESGYSQYQSQFSELLRIYKGELDPAIKADLIERSKSNIEIPKAKGLVMRFVAATQNAYFTNQSFANISPVNKKTEKIAQAQQKAFDFYWNKKMRPFKSLNQVFYDAGIYGTPITKVYWENNMPKIERVGIHEVAFDPSARSRDDLNYMVHNIYLTLDDIRALKKKGVYNKKFKISEIVPQTTGVTDGSNVPFATDTDFSRVQLKEVYTKSGGKWYVSTLYNEGVILREDVELKDGLPFFVGQIIPQPIDVSEPAVRIYGDSMLSGVVALQNELNLRVNQEIDAISEYINPSYITEPGAGLNSSQLKKGAGKHVTVNDLSRLQQMPAPQIAPLLQNQGRIRTDIEEISGVTMLANQDQSAMINRQTATGMDILSGEQNVRINSYIRALNETLFEPMAEHINKLIFKYADIEGFFDGIDRFKETGYSVTIDTGIGSTSPQIKVNQLQMMFDKFVQMGDSESANKIAEMMLKELKFKNTSDFFPDMDDEENRAMAEEQAKQAQEEAEVQKQLAIADAQAKIEEANAKAAQYKAQAQSILAEMKMKEIELQIKAKEVESKYDIDLMNVELKNRELDNKEIESLNREVELD